MAPSGPVAEDPSWGDTAIFKTSLPSCPELGILTNRAMADPNFIHLTGTPAVVWKGILGETIDEIPGYLIGGNSQPVDLPIHVKVMKKRNLKVAIFRVRSLSSDPPVPVPSNAVLMAEFNRIFGWQVNAWLKEEDIIVKPEIDRRYEGGANDGRTLEYGTDAFNDLINSQKEVTADLNIILIGRAELKVPGLTNLTGYRPPGTNSCYVVTGYPDGNNRLPEYVCDTAAHEFGHVMDLQHPDLIEAPAPLIGSPRPERLMYSQHGTVYGNRLVKAEWDEIEKWMKKNKDNKQP
jgi:hypothetical protein